MMASVCTGISHMLLGILGTFVLKRFPTSFSVGFLLGVLVILANQNLVLTGTFFSYPHGNPQTNHAFANLNFALFAGLTLFTLMLFHFKGEIIVSPVDATHPHTKPKYAAPVPAASVNDETSAAEYSQFDDEA